MHLVVKTGVVAAVRQYNKDKEYKISNIDSSFIPALNTKLQKIIEEAVERAKENQRKTLMGRDV